ncbi:MAG: DUF2628 domain-containing protein [Rhizobiales bacterium]|nr:DUF2628 domain-containing protein [Hyphomicrobiales bacterium]MBO6699487.1 DUF2628 domain-containing protein [Hyphomicrobiales bacterium]MBO6737025.1 DUF2628 domain-containing protein [Hyphomicrobiales bacterium]MBO6911901.1 DUF2628 domain-containing protein [Hyphomicrobiales bacterium]MBO6954837.1 DUF2628 domain-containing protein [Hyphomicrobiales bacterium]
MRTYSVFAPPVMPGTLEDDAQSLVFVRHGWSLAALFVPLIWMIVRRLWWVLLGYVILCIAIQLASFSVPVWVTVGVSVALALIIMIEAGQLRLESMAAKGYREIAVIEAPNQKEAERIFFRTWVADHGRAPARPTSSPAQATRGPLHRPTSATPPALPGLSS